MRSYFLDTNICIYYLKKTNEKLAIKILDKAENIKIPAIVAAELIYGAYKSKNVEKSLEIVTHFLNHFPIIAFDSESPAFYGKIRADLEKSGKIIGPNDLIIASIVYQNAGVLVTNNTKEFVRVQDLAVENWVI